MRNTGIFFLAAIAACLGGGTAAADILIATVGPMTGQYASFGEQMRRGAELAVADINAAGGINGEKLVLEVGDDVCDPKQAATVAGDMAARGVKFVAGHFCSGASIPASKIYEQAGILQISPASTNPKFTDEGGWNVARLCGRDDGQGTTAGHVLARDYKDKRIAIIHDGTAYGKGLAEAVQAALNTAGVRETLFEAYAPGERDYSVFAGRLADAAIDVVYVGGYPTEGGLILRGLRDAGSQALMVSADAFASDEFWRVAGAAGEGTILTFAPDPQSFGAAHDIVQRFMQSGYSPEGATLYTYAAIQAYGQAVAEAGSSTDNKRLANWLRSGAALKTVLGEISLDPKGDVKDARYVWYRWHDGKIAEDDLLNR